MANDRSRYRAPVQTPKPKRKAKRRKSSGRKSRTYNTSAGIRDMFYRMIRLKEK